MLGTRTPFKDVPFFWSAHYDMTIRYVGYAQSWDDVEMEGSLLDKDCLIRFRKDEKTLAVATIGRDRAALEQAEILR